MVKIRRAKLRDLDIVFNFGEKLTNDHREMLMKYRPQHLRDFEAKKDAPDIFRAFILRMIRSKNGLILLAEINKKCIGYMIVIIKQNIPIFKLEKLGEITDIYVKEEYQGQGISTKLKDEAFKWLKKKKISKVTLNVFPDNIHSQKVYEKWGFSTFLMEMRKNL